MKKFYPWILIFLSIILAFAAMFYAYNNYSFSIQITNKKTQAIVIEKSNSNIKWISATEISNQKIIDPELIPESMISESEYEFEYYKIGDFINGKYKGSELIFTTKPLV